MPQTFFSSNPNPLLSDLDSDLSQLFAALSIAESGSQVTVTAGVDANNNNTLTWGLASNLQVQTLTANTQLIGKGTTTNDNAPAGYIGEYFEVQVTQANAVTMPSGNVVTLMSLAPGQGGDYETGGVIAFTGNAGTIVFAGGGATLSAANLPDTGNRVNWLGRNSSLPVDFSMTIPASRMSLAANQSVHLNGQSSYGTGTLLGYGRMSMRRRR